MGEFEDLVAAARGGDTSALDTLEEKYSGSALREQAENASAKAREEMLPRLRLAALVEAKQGLDLGDVDITVEDLGDADPDEITPGFVEAKAQEKQAVANQRRQALAEEAGFDTVEEFDAAMALFKEQQETNRNKLETMAGGAGGEGTPPGAPPEKEGHEVMFEDFDAAKDAGMADDYAMAEGVHGLLAHQAPAKEE